MVRVTTIPFARKFTMPSDEELQRLFQMVIAAYPQLDTRWGHEAEVFRSFKHAFLAINHLGRSDAPESKHAHSLPWWCGLVQENLASAGIDADIRIPTFATAVLASADIAHTISARFPHDTAYGLCYGGVGRPATDAWKRVLESGQLLPPVAPPASKNFPPPPVEIRIFG
jgi:hypothetical protein